MNLATDEKQIRQLFEQLTIAWNMGDHTSYAACFTNDGDFITPKGDYVKGKKAIAAVHQQLKNNNYKSAQLINEVQSIRFLSADIALVYGSITTLSWGKDAPASKQSVSNSILTREEGEWKIISFHHCRPQQPSNYIMRQEIAHSAIQMQVA